MLQGIVIVLAIILNGDRRAQIAKLDHDLRIVLFNFERRDRLDDGFDFFQHVRHQNRVIGGQEAT